MMNRLTKSLLRIWISTSSVGAFAIGWSALAHSPKPSPLQVPAGSVSTPAELPALDPVPSLEDLLQGPAASHSAQPSLVFSMPMLRTRGS